MKSSFKTVSYTHLDVYKRQYLYRVTNPRIEDLVDEMLAILSDREAIIQKKELEHAQAVINDMYKNGL